MFEFIDKIVYINLEDRVDRNTEILEVLKDIPSDKVLRFNAIRHHHGGVGCTQSHIAVLEFALNFKWKNVMIVEDDAMWNKFEIGYPILEELIKKDYDVIVLGGAFAKHNNFKLQSCQTTTAYIVNEKYYETLINNYKEGLKGFLTTGMYHIFALDQYWKKLQPLHNWYVTIPSLMIQRAGYSDIEKRITNYNKYFE